MIVPDPKQVVADYERRTAALLERAEEAKAKIKALSGTATSQDGAVTVTVNAAGALMGLSFGREAEEMPRERLAALVLATAKRAQAGAVGRIAEIMEPVVGGNSAAMRFVREQVPDVEVPDEPPPAAGPLRGLNEVEREEAVTPPPVRPPVARGPRLDDESDYDQQDPLMRGDG
ncbi:YbaB/EbfC family nucleoid-associated protein [Actinokineospora enzanensis]|uniref:YbaB/EbfC family nucleoid-associated protein n=1 Tax=Actinokineospora enzanensis TaxID=155975 RepID=UPI00036015CA|nr:YbaB/EbfC family nucleoid-associated protein [Actinokineospora enzanensis]